MPIDGIVLGNVPIPPPGEFASDTVIHPDLGTVLGNVSTDYQDYQCVRTCALHINLHETCSFDVDTDTTLVYVHITTNDKDTYQPPFLSDWSYSGNASTIDMPARDNSKVTTANAYYYTKAVTAGTFEWSWNHSDITKALSYFVGCFLVPSGVAVSNIYPELYDTISDISATYVAPDRDWWWDPAPDVRPSTVTVASTWADLETEINAASAGDVVTLPTGVYDNDGTITLTVSVDESNPIIVCGPATNMTLVPTVELRGSTKVVFASGCKGVRFMHMLDTEGTGNSGDERFQFNEGSSWCSVENIWFNGSSADSPNDAWTHVQLQGSYNRVSNCAHNDKTSRGNHINASPGSGVSSNQFNMVQYCYFKDFNTGELISSGQNAAYIRMGGNSGLDSRMHGIVRYNKFENWLKTPGDSDYLLNKSCGWILAQNVTIANTSGVSMQGYRNEAGSWLTCFGNYHDCTSNNANILGLTAKGNNDAFSAEYDSTDVIYARHYFQDFSGPNGYIQISQQNSTDTDDWIGNNILFYEIYGEGGTDQMIKYGSATSPEEPTNVHVKKVALKTTTSVIQDDYTPSNITYEGCVFNGSSLGVSPTPSGITDSDPGFYDRGDGVMVSDHASLSTAIDGCVPAFLQGPTITDLGTRFTSI